MLLRPHVEPGDVGSFLLVQCADERAEDWVEEAARHAVTQRRCWPSYQALYDAQGSPDVSWLAEHLLVLEIHPQLSAGEIETIERTLRNLAQL
jgi:dTDP-4-amino-4,6-dideoxygalactose transaminase